MGVCCLVSYSLSDWRHAPHGAIGSTSGCDCEDAVMAIAMIFSLGNNAPVWKMATRSAQSPEG